MTRSRSAALVLGALAAAAGAHAQEPETPNKYALLIGVNRPRDIAGVDALRFAEPDATDLEDVLKKRGFDVHTLTANHADRGTIVGQLAYLARVTNPLDTVLIYFSGHGLRARLAKTGTHYHTYWLTYDASVPQMEEK